MRAAAVLFLATIVCCALPTLVHSAGGDAVAPTLVPAMDGKVFAIYSLVWVLAIVIAMGALFRAEATDEYHGSENDALGQ